MKRYSVISKAIAVVLLVVCSLVTISGLVGGMYLYYQGFFEQNERGWMGTAEFSSIVDDYAFMATQFCLSGETDSSLRWRLSREATNYRYIIYDFDSYEILGTNLESIPPLHIRGQNLSESLSNVGVEVYDLPQYAVAPMPEPREQLEVPEDESVDEPVNEPEGKKMPSACLVESFIENDLPVEDEFSQYVSFYVNLRDMPQVCVIAVILGALLCLGLVIYLFMVCGHRPGREEIVLNPLDKIPLDVYFLLLMGVGTCGIAMLEELFWYRGHWWSDMIGIGTCAYWAAGLTLVFLLSCATRAKAGVLWGRSLTARILKWCIRSVRCSVRWLAQTIPMTWQVVGGTAVVLWLMLLLRREPFVMLLLGIIVLMVVTLVAYDLRVLERAGEQLASGETELCFNKERLLPAFRRHGENLENIGQSIDRAVEQRLKSERLKTELITNVSHDIKTPLTSIINYVDLLQKEDLPDPAAEYCAILARQSARLKKLTEDVLEASKASTGNLEVNLQPTDLGELLNQAAGEYQEKLENAGLTLIQSIAGELTAPLDGRLMWRILDNLLGNACKYALPGTRVYLDAARWDGRIHLSVKNISAEPLNISAEELMERFVRGDASRNTEGSGLGLNIARSLAELQGGELKLTVDGDLFKAEVLLPA